MAGTWTLRGGRLDVDWFKEAGRVARTALDEVAVAMQRFLDRPLDMTVEAD